MSDSKYNRLPHAGDFESVNGTEAFYLAPKPLPTGSAAFSGQGMHHDVNDVYLDFAPGKANFEFVVRVALGSNIFFVMFFFLVSVLAAWVRRHKENFFEGWLEFFFHVANLGFYWLSCIGTYLWFIPNGSSNN